jgi:hypothetical protein
VRDIAALARQVLFNPGELICGDLHIANHSSFSVNTP